MWSAAGMPSDERSESAGVVWENAMLRAEARAGRQALKQLHTQVADLTAAVKQNTYMYGPEQMVELLTSLGEGTAALVSERSEAIERLDGWDGKEVVRRRSARSSKGGWWAGSTAAAGGRFRFLAQLVPRRCSANRQTPSVVSCSRLSSSRTRIVPSARL